MNGYTLFHAGKMIRRNEEMVRIDFSKPEHRAYVLTELGGLDHLRQAFPELYAHYIEAVCRDSQQSSKPVQVGSRMPSRTQWIFFTDSTTRKKSV